MLGDPREAALCAMLLGADPTQLATDDFDTPEHRDIHRVLLDLANLAIPPDLVSVGSRLADRHRQALAQLTENATSVANYDHHVRQVRDAVRFAEIRRTSLELSSATERKDRPTTIEAIARLTALAEPDAHSTEHVGHDMARMFDADQPSLPLPLVCLDRLHLLPGSLSCFAARPGGGKTAMLTELARYAAWSGWPALFFTLEMPNRQVRMRLVAAEAGCRWGTAGKESDFIHASQRVAALPIHLRDASSRPTDVQDIVSTSLAFARDKVHPVVFVDYVQIVETRTKTEKRYERIGDICRQLKRLAIRANLPVVVASQLGRATEQRGANSEPNLSDLRESGDIENTCDNVVLMKQDTEHTEKMLLKVSKQRMGPKFKAECRFIEETCTFTDSLD